MLEISAGVFNGNPSARVRDVLWEEVQQYADQGGRALLAHTTNNEQGFTFRTHEHNWHPVDHEGASLISRPNPNAEAPRPTTAPQRGWSKASKRRRFGGA
ncbi:type I-E CRISPR-associated endoribonuclease Cas2e [Streptomyces sp. HNM0645]|uniref:type I-E CRISPR-associated endoribonuclease Cas2e n=1 Tax=Streptomyces sp. HNM0645 TaxID=2782343 RepID=UPI0024B7541D|nr:type I-E CRISPR-associated endoribonuclease Cas2e [Streptomyces sp. HNM0645]MDI9889313.1 type I-E CRISPR-associated endoribonuclease Cas2e [Streptomyces sp. HNM0645]